MSKAHLSSRDLEEFYRDHEDSWRSATNAQQIFRETHMLDEFDPAKMKLPREACDSAQSPRSRGFIIANDVTGSMGRYSLGLIKEVFPRIITQTYDSVSFNPHIMFMGVGDVAAGDEAPLQVTQFETDLRMLDQLQKIWLEGRGGVNDFESYILAWYFAAKHTKMDCFEKRGEKGFLFTFGDEEPTPRLTAHQIERVFGGRDSLQGAYEITDKECLKLASEKFYCYHIILHGNYYSYRSRDVILKWRNLMGSHVCDLSDYLYLPELVATIFKMYEGMSKTEALGKIQNGQARTVVRDALKWHEEYVSDVAVKGDNAESDIEVF